MAVVLHALSFPRFSIFLFGFVFLVPLLDLVEHYRVRRSFLLFFFFSFFSYLIILYWIPHVMVRYGGMSSPISILGLIILCAFLALFHGIAGIYIKKIMIHPLHSQRALLLIPLIWVAKDCLIEHIFGGFPWCLAGYSQVPNLYFIQVAEWGGIHLVTFLVIFFNIAIYRFLRGRHPLHHGIAILISLFSIYTVGHFLYRNSISETQALPVHQVGIIQPNTSNDYVSKSEKEKILNRLLAESRQLAQQGAEFVIWPEHSLSIYPLQDSQQYRLLNHFTQTHVPLLAGFTDIRENNQVFNAAILFEKHRYQKYDKVHLTPFGEYVLFREILFFVKRITDEIADFTPGSSVKNLQVNGHAVSTPICYEIIFPGLVRSFISRGGEVIVTISNDSWFGHTAAPFQHLYMGSVRSIENRRYILRSTTNGISSIVAPTGELVHQTTYGTAGRFLGKFSFIKRITLFTRFGYLFPYFCLLLLLLYTIYAWIISRRPHPLPPYQTH